jgi:hypothetical protein
MAGVSGLAAVVGEYYFLSVVCHVASPLYDLVAFAGFAIVENNGDLVRPALAVAAATGHPHLTGLLATFATTAAAGLERANLFGISPHAIAARAADFGHGDLIVLC